MENILKSYDDNSFLYEEFRIKTENLLRDLIRVEGMACHQITSRLKTKESLSNKISNKLRYSKLQDITDVVGCRIITYFEDEVDKIATIIDKEFQVDYDNTVDKRKVDYDRFGYLSLHYVVKLNDSRLQLSEYKKFKDCSLEIQIRSLLQHGWAEIEHDIGYKGKYSIPDLFRRKFSRIAALLETADLEFIVLREDLRNYEKNVEKRIQSEPEKVPIDKASLLSFVLTNPDLKRLDKIIAVFESGELVQIDSYIYNIINYAHFCNLNSIFELEQVLSANFDCILKFTRVWREVNIKARFGSKPYNLPMGLGLHDVLNYYIAKTKTKSQYQLFLETAMNETIEVAEWLVDSAFSSYSKLDTNCR